MKKRKKKRSDQDSNPETFVLNPSTLATELDVLHFNIYCMSYLIRLRWAVGSFDCVILHIALCLSLTYALTSRPPSHRKS